MNDPARPLPAELRRLHAQGFDAFDVTLEPPGAWPVDAAELVRLLDGLGAVAVGHTGYYLPVASQYDEIEASARDVFRRQLEVFAAAGIMLVNVHPQRHGFEYRSADELRARNAVAIGRLCRDAAAVGCEVMVENMVQKFGSPDA